MTSVLKLLFLTPSKGHSPPCKTKHASASTQAAAAAIGQLSCSVFPATHYWFGFGASWGDGADKRLKGNIGRSLQ